MQLIYCVTIIDWKKKKKGGVYFPFGCLVLRSATTFLIALFAANQNARTSVHANVILTNEIVMFFISATQAHLSSANEKRSEEGVRVKAYL